MRRKRPIQKGLFWRNRRGPRQALRPFLYAIRPEAPPEGLLHRIERELEGMPIDRPKKRSASRRYLAMPVAAAACIGLAILLLEVAPGEPIALLDPTERAVAQIHQRNGDAVVKLLSGSATGEARKVWHLWGILPGEARPVHIGILADAGLVVRNPERFAGYAISMEDTGFAGDVPIGPVIALRAAE